MLTQLHADALLRIAPTVCAARKNSPLAEQGFEIDEGWFDVLLEALVALEAIAVALPASESIRLSQVKEKAGGLCIYYDGSIHKSVEEVIAKAEKDAARTCERCGHINGAHTDYHKYMPRKL
jgi:hypothetical protein